MDATADDRTRGFAALAEEHATPGRLHEQLLDGLAGAQMFGAVRQGLDAVWNGSADGWVQAPDPRPQFAYAAGFGGAARR